MQSKHCSVRIIIFQPLLVSFSLFSFGYFLRLHAISSERVKKKKIYIYINWNKLGHFYPALLLHTGKNVSFKPRDAVSAQLCLQFCLMVVFTNRWCGNIFTSIVDPYSLISEAKIKYTTERSVNNRRELKGMRTEWMDSLPVLWKGCVTPLECVLHEYGPPEQQHKPRMSLCTLGAICHHLRALVVSHCLY